MGKLKQIAFELISETWNQTLYFADNVYNVWVCMIFVIGVIAVPQSDSASNTDYPEIDFLPSPSDCHLYACLVMICFEALVTNARRMCYWIHVAENWTVSVSLWSSCSNALFTGSHNLSQAQVTGDVKIFIFHQRLQMMWTLGNICMPCHC